MLKYIGLCDISYVTYNYNCVTQQAEMMLRGQIFKNKIFLESEPPFF